MLSVLVLAALAAGLALLPPAAAAQEATASPDTRLQIERTRRRLLVRPDLPLPQAQRDVDRAVADLGRPRVAEETVQPRRPPQLDPGVTTAVQARNLQRARRR